MSFLDCPFHKYFVIPFVNIFTFGIYGSIHNIKKLESYRTAIYKNEKSKIEN